MHTKYLQSLLAFIALLGVAHASVTECTIQAWVRAPDLAPNTIVQGDARVKISAECPTVETVTLGLRLKERSFIETWRSPEDKTKLDLAQSQTQPVHSQRMTARGLSHFPFPDATPREMLVDRDLWIVREEERLVFETTQVIQMMARGISGNFDVVQDFAVLVPSTNFPPALDCSYAMVMQFDERVDAEFVYEYFIRVSFADGTTEDISAGITSFQPLHDPAEALQQPTSLTTGLESMIHTGGSPVTRYSAQVSGNLVFTQGCEDQVVDVVITRIGPARIFTAPLMIRGCVKSNLSSKWAIEYGMPSSRPMCSCGHGTVLRATPEDVQEAYRNRMPGWGTICDRVGPSPEISITLPNSTLDEIQSGEIVTTTSTTVAIPIKVNRRQVTDFETYYQALANSLQIMLATPRTDVERVDPDHPSVNFKDSTRDPRFTDDEEPWVPFDMDPASGWTTYTGGIPLVVLPINEIAPSQHCLLPRNAADASGPGQVVLPDRTVCERRSLTHYLDEGARGPIFVDSNAVHEILAESPMVRDRRAPLLEWVVSSPPKGELGLACRYCNYDNPGGPRIYVGETWVKKVLNRGEHL